MTTKNGVPENTKVVWQNFSKTSPPRLLDHLIKREHLLARLNDALDCQASYLIAPAGYGKSTLLSQWYHELVDRRVTCLWLNIEESDKDIRIFFSYLVLALDEAGISTGSLKEAAERGFPGMTSTEIGSEILVLFGHLTRKTVVILDDFHAVKSPQFADFLQAAQKCGYGMMHFAIASRNHVGGDSSALVASGNAIVIEAQDLRFSNHEVRLAIGEEIDCEMLNSLQTKVEGWPFGVQITRIAAQSDGLASAISTLSGYQGHVAEFLVSHVTDILPRPVFEFVAKMALFDRFSSKLADQVCGHQISHDLMIGSNLLGSFIVPIDDSYEWFRCHHLFAECLLNLNKQDSTSEIEKSYRLGIQWFENQGRIAEAVKYSNLIADHTLARTIVKKNGGWLLALTFGPDYLEKILRSFPESEIQKDARLLLASAYLHLSSGDLKKAQSYCRSADVLIEDSNLSSSDDLDRICVNGAIAGISELPNENSDGSFDDHLKIAKRHGNFCSGFVQALVANELIMRGDFHSAKKYAETACLLLQSGHSAAAAGYAHQPLAVGAFYRGEFDEARRQFGLVAETSLSGQDSKSKENFGLGGYAIDYWQGKLKGEEIAGLYQELDVAFATKGGFDNFVIGTEALFHNAVSGKNVEEAQRVIDTLFIANMRYDIARIEKYCDILQLELCLAKGQLAKAEIYYSKIRKWHSADNDQDEKSYWMLDILAGYARAQFLAAIGYTKEAISHLDEKIDIAENLSVVPVKIKGDVLKASIFHSVGDFSNAKICLMSALEEAAPLQMHQIFTDAYVPGQLIGMVREDISESDQSPLTKEFVEQVYLVSQDGLLNDRERDVLVGISNGMTNKEIAHMLNLTESTIKFHQRKLYKKFGVSKRVNAISKARELNMLI